MSKTSSSRRNQRLIPLAALALVLTIFAGLYPTEPSTAWGALAGGLLTVGALTVMLLRHPNDAGSLERTMRGEADERDRLIAMEASSWTGGAAFACLTLGLVATAWGLDARYVLTAAIWVLLMVQFASHWWLQQHH